MRLNKPELRYLLLGCLVSVVEGLTWPAFSIVLSELLAVLINPDGRSEVNKWCLAFVIVGLLSFGSLLAKFYCLTYAGEALTKRLRQKSFRAILYKDAAWFDEPRHRKHILTTRLSSDSSRVRGIVGERLGMMISCLSTLLGGVIVAFVYCWRIALVVLAACPAVAIGGALQMKLMTGFSQSKEFEDSSKFAGQAVEHIRTVLSLGRTQAFFDGYMRELQKPTKRVFKLANVQGDTLLLSSTVQ